jgi:hypothetical protein
VYKACQLRDAMQLYAQVIRRNSRTFHAASKSHVSTNMHPKLAEMYVNEPLSDFRENLGRAWLPKQ